jgi:hypothetical protein
LKMEKENHGDTKFVKKRKIVLLRKMKIDNKVIMDTSISSLAQCAIFQHIWTTCQQRKMEGDAPNKRA